MFQPQIESRLLAQYVQTLEPTARAQFYVDVISNENLVSLYPDAFLADVSKHESHDQSTHGSWANGDLDAGGGTNSPSVDVSISSSGGLNEYSYGDIEIVNDYESGYHGDLESAFSTWGAWEGNFGMRMISAGMMGLNQPHAEDGGRMSDELMDAYKTGTGTLSNDDKQQMEMSFMGVHTMMKKIQYAEPTSEPMYRGILADSRPFEALKAGAGFTMPLSAFSSEIEIAKVFSDRATELNIRGGHGEGVIFTLQPRARGVNNNEHSNRTGFTNEFVTAGKFEIVSVGKLDGIANVIIKQTAVPRWGGGYDTTR